MAKAKTAAQIAADEAAEADERDRARGAALGRAAAAAVGSPIKPPMTLPQLCKMATEANQPIMVVAVPQRYVLTLDFGGADPMSRERHWLGKYWGAKVDVPAGPQQMPTELASHWWSETNGVKVYVPPQPAFSEPVYSKAQVDVAIAEAIAKAKAEFAVAAPKTEDKS